MAPWLSPAAPKRVSGELRLSDGAETASSVAGAYCLITPDALLTRWYPANFLRWGNRIFTNGEGSCSMPDSYLILIVHLSYSGSAALHFRICNDALLPPFGR